MVSLTLSVILCIYFRNVVYSICARNSFSVIKPHVLHCFADDMLIKLWDWEKKWVCSQVFEGHTHYVMQIVINPKDNNTFASASLDRTVKVGKNRLYMLVPLSSVCFTDL